MTDESKEDPLPKDPLPAPLPEDPLPSESAAPSSTEARKALPLRPASFHPLNALAILLLVLGMISFNNYMVAWQLSQQSLSGPEIRPALMGLALQIVMAVFLMLLGIQLLFKRRWAYHFVYPLRQMAQLAMLLIPISMILALFNRDLMDNLSSFYQEVIQKQMQQMGNQDLDLSKERIHRILQATFWLLSFLGMGVCGLVLRLSKYSLSPELQKLFAERSREAGPLSQFILHIPKPFVFLLLLAIYGATLNLLTLVSSLGQFVPFLISLLSFGCFALALLQLTHKNITENHIPLKNALFYCAMAYGLQLLGVLLKSDSMAEGLEQSLEQFHTQVTVLSSIVMLLYFAWLYRKYLKRAAA